LAVCTILGFALRLVFESLVGKAYAKAETPLFHNVVRDE
jgi:hypothetical protein